MRIEYTHLLDFETKCRFQNEFNDQAIVNATVVPDSKLVTCRMPDMAGPPLRRGVPATARQSLPAPCRGEP